MRGPVADALNPTNRPTPSQVKALGADAVNLTFFHDDRFYAYHSQLRRAGMQTAVRFPQESFALGYSDTMAVACDRFGKNIPDLWVILNEPNVQEAAGVEHSSWTLEPEDAARIYNEAAGTVKQIRPAASIHFGGLMGGPGEWFRGAWQTVNHELVDGIDIHYPESEGVLQEWSSVGLPLSCGEWCYSGRSVTKEQVRDWQGVLSAYCKHSFWFTWGYRTDMALVSPATGRKLKAWGNYHAALVV